MKPQTEIELQASLDALDGSPRDNGVLDMIVIRPAMDERRVLQQGELSVNDGLAGDSWRLRGSSTTKDGRAEADMQIAIMNSRVIRTIAGERDRWPLAGDQLFIDLDLSQENLPAGTQLLVGAALLEVTPIPHTGCKKFSERFGSAAIRWVNSPEGRRLRLRGLYARVVRPGHISVRDPILVKRRGKQTPTQPDENMR